MNRKTPPASATKRRTLVGRTYFERKGREEQRETAKRDARVAIGRRAWSR